ncbi:hypothetical protein [Nocardioides sp.]|uniref:hypothetical protein n=1 Tax=Nocardioides sp. TaxID=35761 RepID=UPI003564FB4F
MTSRRAVAALLAGALLFLLAGIVLWFDNPTVDVTASDLGTDAPAGAVVCSIAPWDAGLHHNDSPPGGEHAAGYAQEVAADCFAANTVRFRSAVGSGAVALGLVGAAAVVGSRTSARRPGR